MANLETLTLEINANADGASSGIQSLISSLSALGQAASSNLASLQALSSTLKEIRTAATGGNIWKNLAPNSSGAVKEIHKVTAATKEMTQTWADTHKIAPIPLAKPTIPGMKRWNEQTQQWDPFIKAPVPVSAMPKATQVIGDGRTPSIKFQTSATLEATAAIKEHSSALQESTNVTAEHNRIIDESGKSISDIAKEEKEATTATKEFTNATRSFGSVQRPVQRASGAVKGFFTSVLRIGKTMLIRSILRDMMKSTQEGLEQFYEASKKVGGKYAESLDTMKKKTGQFKLQFSVAIGTALSGLSPILEGLASLALEVANALSMVFAMLTGQTTYGKVSPNGAGGGFVANAEENLELAKDSASALKEAVANAGEEIDETNKKITNTLAKFDDLNVIARESGGGGAKSAGKQSYKIEFPTIPQEWLEWLPLIKALVSGVLSALILPKVWDWIKKIIDALRGIPQVPKKVFPEQPDYKDYPEMPQYGEFPIQPEYKPFPVAPDYAKTSAEMLTIAGALAAAAGSAEALFQALEKINGLLTAKDLLSNLFGILTGLLGKLLKPTLKIEVDTSKFDEVNKQVKEWMAEHAVKVIEVHLNRLTHFEPGRKIVDEWVNNPSVKVVDVHLNTISHFDRQKQAVDAWVKENMVKVIEAHLNLATHFEPQRKRVDNWVKETATKLIDVHLNTISHFDKEKKQVESWVKDTLVKVIDVHLNTVSHYDKTKKAIDKWANDTATKTIAIAVDTNSFDAAKKSLDEWAEKKMAKTIVVLLDNLSLTKVKEKVDEFTKVVEIKHIKVSIDNLAEFAISAGLVTAWTALQETKSVSISMITKLYDLFVSALATWIAANPIKHVTVSVEHTSYDTIKQDVDTWVGEKPIKVLKVGFETTSYLNFVALSSQIDAWANTSLTKTITIVTKTVTQGTPTTPTDQGKKGVQWTWKDGLTIDGKDLFTWTKDLLGFAGGGYGIPKGELFIANEAGAELIGSMDGKTTVANQTQIITGIQRGVYEANAEQNQLLREQNNLLRGILQKDNSIRLGASVALGRTVKKSLDLYGNAVGG